MYASSSFPFTLPVPIHNTHSWQTTNMEPKSDFEVDPALAAAMGFAGFGTQPSNLPHKRKFASHDAFVDPHITAAASFGTGANILPTRDLKTVRIVPEAGRQAEGSSLAASRAQSDGGGGEGGEGGVVYAQQQQQQQPVICSGPQKDDCPSLELLRYGVRNTKGDMVYFLPSFLEDPWAGLG